MTSVEKTTSGPEIDPSTDVAVDDSDVTDAPDVVSDDGEGPTTRGAARPGKTWWAVCLVLIVAILALAGWGLVSYFDQQDSQTQTGESATVRKAASDGAVAILSYKPQTVDQDLAKAKTLITGDFLDYYTRFTTQVVGPASKQKQVATSATVPVAGVQNLSADKAVVLVMVNQQTTSADNPQPAQSASSVRVELTKKNGKWLIDKFDPV